jgi:2-oxoglutarate dehydrogenase E1 component
MEGDTIFQRYLPDPHPENLAAPEQIRRHVLCSGQVYYQLLQEREKRGINDIAISRVEQISPLPYDMLTPHLDKYPNADLVWAQEEVSSSDSRLFKLHSLLTASSSHQMLILLLPQPLNNGAWTYVQPRLITALKQTEHHKSKVPIYAGRKPSSSVATGSKAAHKKEVEMINDMAFGDVENGVSQ